MLNLIITKLSECISKIDNLRLVTLWVLSYYIRCCHYENNISLKFDNFPIR